MPQRKGIKSPSSPMEDRTESTVSYSGSNIKPNPQPFHISHKPKPRTNFQITPQEPSIMQFLNVFLVSVASWYLVGAADLCPPTYCYEGQACDYIEDGPHCCGGNIGANVVSPFSTRPLGSFVDADSEHRSFVSTFEGHQGCMEGKLIGFNSSNASVAYGHFATYATNMRSAPALRMTTWFASLKFGLGERKGNQGSVWTRAFFENLARLWCEPHWLCWWDEGDWRRGSFLAAFMLS